MWQPIMRCPKEVTCLAIAGAGFVGLNVLDGWLTKELLEMGGREANPVVAAYGSSMLVKGLLASGTVLLLIRLGKPGVLRLLNIGMLAVCCGTASGYTCYK